MKETQREFRRGIFDLNLNFKIGILRKKAVLESARNSLPAHTHHGSADTLTFASVRARFNAKITQFRLKITKFHRALA